MKLIYKCNGQIQHSSDAKLFSLSSLAIGLFIQNLLKKKCHQFHESLSIKDNVKLEIQIHFIIIFMNLKPCNDIMNLKT